MPSAKKLIRVQSVSKRTGDSMEVESEDGKKTILPLFRWTVSVHDVEAKEKKPRKSTWVEKVEYHLHPTFAVPIRGYGSFDMRVVIYFTDPAVPPHSFVHPLRLDKEKSEDYHTLKFKDVSDDFYRALIGGADARKKQPSQLIVDDEQEQELLYGYDVDVLANKLHSLAGDKVLKVVELLKKYRTKTTYMEEDNGEFHFDLYTLSPDAVAALWLAVSDD